MKLHTLLLASLATATASAVPCAENVTFTQDGSTVTVTYALTESPAIVTISLANRTAFSPRLPRKTAYRLSISWALAATIEQRHIMSKNSFFIATKIYIYW